MIDTGWVRLHRKILDWEWFKDSNTFHLFIYLLLNANHQTGYYQGIEVKRVQLITGRKKISSEIGLSEQNVRTSLHKLEKTQNLTIKTTNKFSIITICNYDSYQSEKSETNQQTNQQLTNNQPTTNQQLTTNNNNKNNKNEKNEKKNTDVYPDFLKLFNETTGKKYRKLDNKTQNHLKELQTLGFTQDDILNAIKNCMADEFHQQNNMKFLTPEFITRTDKLEKFLNYKPLPVTVNGSAKSAGIMAKYGVKTIQ